ncbi:sensor domain-containing protein [Paraglaciecola hydrolytica]|uniref:cyclic-guanylate-specific phosphodiesterase n=1 Tax=Paraglaciecola hydrolytica TaxID=1799789 RepID=A0A136A4S3_9ALTE|nr:bifunctional diguanylate cyclase/phosphodiesterase [Paraglaciecola hydrolytica]KXI30242.1 diguanylate phosphodiesterase [Paraglaciecola hydrolytica]
MSIDASLFQALGLVNSSIFQRIAPGQFKTLYQSKGWLLELMPEAFGSSPFIYQQNSAFLNDFLLDAEEFWQNGQNGQIHSGIWREQANQTLLHLEASAAVAENNCYLLIHNIENEYQRQQQTLQVARELLIRNDKVLAQHDYVFNRLETLLSQSTDKKPEPLQHALQQTELGVAILDDKLQLLNSNPALYQMFAIPGKKVKQSPDKLLLQLFENQYPEYHRVFATGSAWAGELYWLNPPQPGKWFKVSVHPICNTAQQKNFWLLSISDISQLKFLLMRNEKLSHYDVLTELPNRQYFWQQLEQQISKQQAFFVLYMEIKQFKKINEIHGHLVGDGIIKELAGRLKACINSSDMLARIGGTEFALIVHTSGLSAQVSAVEQDKCQQMAKELITACIQPFYIESGHRCEVGLNIGAAAFPSDADNAEDLMKYADLAVFAAKKQLKSSLQFYSKELKEASRKRIELEVALRKALENQEFELYFQPMFDLRDGKINKAEALIRWNRPDVGMVSPDEFIPLAEQTGLIVPIGKWVIKETCEKLAALQAAKLAIILSINLSPRQVNDRHLLEFITDCVAECQVLPSQLELELTEGVLIDNFTKVQYLLNEVRKLGLSVSIDDFGTGYSSLAYLQKLPIDHLKIDRSFVQDLSHSENDKALVLAVIAMAHSLKLQVIAEGVETEQQKEFLQLNNCHTAQGYLFSRPIPFDQLSTLLANQANAIN